jgi:AcrR family transcriptional regulator
VTADVQPVVSERRRQLVEAALGILEAEGPDGLTMRSLAERVGIRAPSLYKHVADKDELTALLIAEAFRGFGAAVHAAVEALPRGASTTTKLRALGRAYRSWALAHPHLYRLATGGELRRDLLPEGLEAWAAEPVVAAAGSESRARAVWAFAHGTTILELDGRFPLDADLDAAWEQGIRAFGGAGRAVTPGKDPRARRSASR